MKKRKIDYLVPYLVTSIIVILILGIVFYIKKIYPFGENSLIWGDMHDQITAFYYHFYDSLKGNGSLLVDFTTSSGINFLGILAYYILSPFSLLVLLVPRADIYLMVSVIIGLKILCCSLTCLYFIRKFYKDLPSLLSVLLAIIYGFSGYSLIMYQITPWIDAMYLFPLIVIGLKKVLDLEKTTLYIITLSLSLIFSFYVTIMVIIFIFLASFIYLLVYKNDKKLCKKGVLALGISTVLSLLLSMFIVVPSYMQISVSSRIGFNLNTLLNSKLGPITDKLSMFMFGAVMYIGLLLLVKKWKQNRKFLSFYIPTLLIVMIPVFIEPINKIWHFGSYAFFPYRFGFITMFLLILGACQGFINFQKLYAKQTKNHYFLSILITLLACMIMITVTFLNYHAFQKALETLTISINHHLLFALMFSIIVAIISCLTLIYLNKSLNRFVLILVMIISITHISLECFLYLGIDHKQDILMKQYKELAEISKTYKNGNYYRVKNEAANMIMNSGMVMKYHTLDHFTSLTDKNNLESLKKIGYSSMWVKTFSRGGNLFLDSVLANKYLITRKKVKSEYYTLLNSYDNLKFYELKNEPSYGYFITHNDSIFDKDNSFLISNSLYQNITNDEEPIFDIIKTFTLHNIKISNNNEYLKYEIIDEDGYSYLEANVSINGKKTIYLEALKSLINNQNADMYEKFNIYINDKLYKQKAFGEYDNGVLNLGTYRDENINIKIELTDDVSLSNLTLGIMDNSKYENFINQNKVDTKVEYDKNKIHITVNANEKKILFLPINYSESYKATNNGKKIETLKLYDNYIGVELSEGENDITLTYMPKGFMPCLVISLITVGLSIILTRKNIYNKLLNNKILFNFAYYAYLFVYLLTIIIIYVGLTVAFIISYFVSFNF